MKFFIGILLLLSTTGCSSPSQRLEDTLNEYAKSLASFNSEAATLSHLTGPAKIATEQSQQLLTELGYLQSGLARFQVLELVDRSKALACLDVSAVELRDQTGVKVNSENAPNRLELIVDFKTIGEEILISDFEATGDKC